VYQEIQTDRDPDLQVSGDGLRSGVQQTHRSGPGLRSRGSRKTAGQVRSQVRGSQRSET
jgi:hypothetical protein